MLWKCKAPSSNRIASGAVGLETIRDQHRFFLTTILPLFYHSKRMELAPILQPGSGIGSCSMRDVRQSHVR
jgi:hypothetical protein